MPVQVCSSRGDVVVHSLCIIDTQRHREEGGHGNEYVVYLIESSLVVHGVRTTLRSARRFKHFIMLDQLLQQQFGRLVPQEMPAKRAFGNLHPGFVEERRSALERYLQLCLAIPELASSSSFLMFLEAGTPGSALGCGGMEYETYFEKLSHVDATA